MCRFFDVSRGGYYDCVKRMNIPAQDLPLVEKMRECQEKCGKTYGYRRVRICLERQGNISQSQNNIESYANIQSIIRSQKKEIS